MTTCLYVPFGKLSGDNNIPCLLVFVLHKQVNGWATAVRPQFPPLGRNAPTYVLENGEPLLGHSVHLGFWTVHGFHTYTIPFYRPFRLQKTPSSGTPYQLSMRHAPQITYLRGKWQVKWSEHKVHVQFYFQFLNIFAPTLLRWGMPRIRRLSSWGWRSKLDWMRGTIILPYSLE